MSYICKRCGARSAVQVLAKCYAGSDQTTLTHDWGNDIQYGWTSPVPDPLESVPRAHTITVNDMPEHSYGAPVPEVICTMEQAHEVLKVTESAWDNQVGGDHYHKPGQISPFEYSMANGHNCLEFSIVKYLRKKGDKQQRLQDLEKLIDCAQKLLEWEKTHECE